MLNYSLHENVLTERTDDYAAQTHPAAVYAREQFIDLMLQRGTLVTKTDIMAVFNDMEETAGYIIESGGTINLPLFHTAFSISGVFDSALDTFDPTRHKLHVTVQKGTVLREKEKEVKPVKINAPSPQPQVLEVKDCLSGQVNTALTPNGVVEIDGINIKLAGDNAAVGLYFVDALNPANAVKAEAIIHNKPSSVLAMVPGLLPNHGYRIKIVTQYSIGKVLKEPKTTIYEKTLQTP
jgi:hypothetical protein